MTIAPTAPGPGGIEPGGPDPALTMTAFEPEPPAGEDGRFRRRRKRLSASSRVTVIVPMCYLGVVALAALIPGLLAPGDPTELYPRRALAPPSSNLPLGADQYGRSVYTLIVHGSRSAVIIGLSSVLLAMLVGGLIGLLGGYFGGGIDTMLGRVIDILMCFPGILLALLITAALGPSVRNVIISVAIATIPGFARIMRAQVLAVRSRLFIEAARATGLPQGRILARYILPNAIAPIVVLATVSVGVSIVLAASLSFLGVGPASEVPDWGQLLASGQAYLGTAWWISTFAGLVLTLTVISVSLLGDWLRDRLDVAS